MACSYFVSTLKVKNKNTVTCKNKYMFEYFFFTFYPENR